MRSGLHPLLVAQGLATLVVVAILAVQPRAGRPLLVVPLSLSAPSSAMAATIVRTGMAHGALLVGTGPLPGSVVLIRGDGDLTTALHAAGAITVLAPPTGCGSVA